MAKPLTREEAIDLIFHELRGRCLEAVLYDRKGAELSLFVRNQSDKMYKRIGEILDLFKPPPAPPEQAATDPVKAAPPRR